MKNRKELYNELLELAKNNIPPLKEHLNISIDKSNMLADYYKANKDIVKFSILLMDIKLGEAIKNNLGKEHVKMSSNFAKEFLKQSDFTSEEQDKIINCIDAHHGDVPFTCIEAEICANADCYRFIHPVGVFSFLLFLSKNSDNLIENIKSLKFKLDEKKHILSLTKAKVDLNTYYELYSKQFDEIINYLNNK